MKAEINLFFSSLSFFFSSSSFFFSFFFSSSSKVLNALHDIDAHAWVVEPENPSFDSLYRRIALERRCSLTLSLDCRRPQAVPGEVAGAEEDEEDKMNEG